jgi:hypothetical protein
VLQVINQQIQEDNEELRKTMQQREKKKEELRKTLDTHMKLLEISSVSRYYLQHRDIIVFWRVGDIFQYFPNIFLIC